MINYDHLFICRKSIDENKWTLVRNDTIGCRTNYFDYQLGNQNLSS